MGMHKLYRFFYRHVVRRINPVCYAKKIGVNMGEEVHIYGNVEWASEPWIITLGNNVHITDGVKFITHDGGTLLFREEVPDLEVTKPIIIGNDVYIGNNVIILPGVNIGNRVVIGAGSVVTRNIPDNSLVVGIPGRVIKSADEYIEKLKRESLHLGHLRGQDKDRELMKYYQYEGDSKGIYF